MAIIPGAESINWQPIVGNIMYWVGWGFVYIIVLSIMVIVWYLWKFRIKVTVIPLYGSGKEGAFSFGKPQTNRVKWINNKKSWKSLFPLMNKIEREPFDPDLIYNGNRIFAFSLNDTWIPGKININQKAKDWDKVLLELKKKYPDTEDKDLKFLLKEAQLKYQKQGNGTVGEINPVPYYIRNWQSLTHKKHAAEFAKMGFWEENKFMLMTIGVILFNLVLCGAVIYFTYKFAAGGRSEMQSLTTAIKNIGNIPATGAMIPK